jgi:flagellar motor switch protein FliN/FliY
MADENPKPSEPSAEAPPTGPATPGAGDASATAMAEEALNTAQQAVTSLQAAAKPGTPADSASEAAQPFEPQAFDRSTRESAPKGIDLLSDVNLNVKIELGRTRMLVEDVLKLSEGAVVELDKLAGDPVDVYANERHIARGEVLVLNDNFCVRINEILADGEVEAIKSKR